MGNKPDWWEVLVKKSAPEPRLDGLKLLRTLAESKPEVKLQPQPIHPNPLTRISLKRNFHVTEELKLAVWQKAATVSGSNPAQVRRDSMGDLMWFGDYGNCDSILGWQIDHIIPRSKGGSDLLPNLQPFNWKNNLRKGDKTPSLRLPPLSL